MKYLNLTLLLAFILLFGCQKENHQPPVAVVKPSVQNNYKIEILKGNNQIDSIGHTLKDSVIIRVTNNGKLLKYGYLRFTGSGCDVNTPTEVGLYTGLAFFKWQLSGVIGTQQLKVVLLDSARVALDSLTATATAVMPLHGWQPSPCMTPYNSVKKFCKLKTGKLFALFANTDFLFTSDDNGVNWHKLSETDNHYQISSIVTGPDDGLFILTQGNGVLYSSDAGKTWIPRNNDIAYFAEADGLYTTTLGKILVTVHSDGKTYTTTDDGLNWSTTDLNIYEQPNGNNYFVDNMSTLRVSTNEGLSWNYVSAFPVTAAVGLQFIDDKGYLYITESSSYNDVKLYRSTDNGLTFAPVYSGTYVQGTPLAITQFSEVNNTFYFYAYGSGIIKTTDFKAYTNISSTFTEESRAYVVTNSNRIIIGLYYGSIYYYLP